MTHKAPHLFCATLLALAAATLPAHAQTAPAQQQGGEHQGHGGQAQPPPSGNAGGDQHAGHQPPASPPAGAPVRPLTDADRAAAFPDVSGHAVHDTGMHSFVLFDSLEWRTEGGVDSGAWDMSGWVGRDLDRVWFRSEGAGTDSGVRSAEAHLLYGRTIARWWDLVLGVRQDVRPGPARTWAAVGIQGLAPYWINLELTGYVGGSGRTHLRVEAEQDLLLTNRLVLQPQLEVNVLGKSDPERRLGAGLSTAEAGLRLRYEIRRELAPYVGVLWERRFFDTADFAEAAGEPSGRTRLVLGMRVWF